MQVLQQANSDIAHLPMNDFEERTDIPHTFNYEIILQHTE